VYLEQSLHLQQEYKGLLHCSAARDNEIKYMYYQTSSNIRTFEITGASPTSCMDCTKHARHTNTIVDSYEYSKLSK